MSCAVVELAAALAAGPAGALGRTKALLRGADASPLVDQLERERLAQIDNSSDGNVPEGLRSFAEKREPRFG